MIFFNILDEKKKILIFLNKTSLAHTQIINSEFLNFILKKNKITLVSNYNFKKSKLLKILDVKMVQLNETKQNSFYQSSYTLSLDQ